LVIADIILNLPEFKLYASPKIKINIQNLPGSTFGLAQVTDSINIGFPDIGFFELAAFTPEAVEVRAVKLSARAVAGRLAATDILRADCSRQSLR